jgi:uncharacterized protein with HEPN domain
MWNWNGVRCFRGVIIHKYMALQKPVIFLVVNFLDFVEKKISKKTILSQIAFSFIFEMNRQKRRKRN